MLVAPPLYEPLLVHPVEFLGPVVGRDRSRPWRLSREGMLEEKREIAKHEENDMDGEQEDTVGMQVKQSFSEERWWG